MTRANTEQQKNTPWFAKAGAACSIVPISRFVSDHIFALKGGGYGCLFGLSGIDEESLAGMIFVWDSEMRNSRGSSRLSLIIGCAGSTDCSREWGFSALMVAVGTYRAPEI